MVSFRREREPSTAPAPRGRAAVIFDASSKNERLLIGLGAVSARAAFVIDRHGVIQYSEQTPTPKDLPNFNAIRDTLGKLK